MKRIYFGYGKNLPPKGFVYALLCDNKFYVISQKEFLKAQTVTKCKRPVFYTDLRVYVDGINI